MSQSVKILIIGAGASGIAAATKLIESGYHDVLIIEAENRIGGRIFTIPFGANVLDMGAQWCHGEKDNVVYETAKKHQEDIFGSSGKIYSKFVCVKSNKEVVPDETVAKLSAIIHNCMSQSKEMMEFKGSLGDFLIPRFNKALEEPENSNIDKSIAKKFLDFHQKFECSLDACDTLFDISAAGYTTYWECEGDLLLNWKGKGYISFLKILMHSTDSSRYGILTNKILLNKKVEEICWTPDSEGKISIRCSDGIRIVADHVICTVSLGVLKEKQMKLFNPLLPELKQRAIQGLGIGNVDKMFIEFSKPFWPENWPGICLLWEDEDLEMIRKREDSWLEGVFGFYPVDYQPNILCGWIVGVHGRQMEASSEDVVKNGLVFLLKKFLSWDIPDPVNFKRSTWYLNSNFRGSYSFRDIKSEEFNTSPADLAYPLTNSNGIPALQFAGEATSDHYYSTVHGAVESGWREAKRLTDFYNNCNISILNNRSREILMERNNSNSEDDEDEIFDVIIVGAGLAGLGAGYCLAKNNSNLKFIILEAQDYIGGRIHTANMHLVESYSKGNSSSSSHFSSTFTSLPDIIDSGAQWLHGEQNKLFEIASEHNLLTSELSEEGLGEYFRDDGTTYDEFFRKKIDFVIGRILEECEEFIAIKTEESDDDYNDDDDDDVENNEKVFPQSVGHFLREKFNDYVLRKIDDPKQRQYAMELFDWHNRFQVIDNSCLNLEQLSAKFWGMYSFNGESCQAHINFKKGFSTITDALKQIIGLDRIHKNSVVCDINWNYEGIGQTSSKSAPKPSSLISIQTCDKRNYVAKHIICTFSLGVLKDNEHKLFRPQLPNKIRTAIHSIGFECINKIFLQFKEPWWLPMGGIQFVFSDNNYKNCKWTRYMTGFDILQPGSSNTLVGWIGSYGAIEMEQLTDEEIINDCIEVLTKFTKRKVPNPLRFYCSRWHSNKFIRGGYSYLGTKCEKLNITGKNLTTPVTLQDLKSTKLLKTIDTEIIENLKDITLTDKLYNDERKAERNEENDDYPLILFAGEACHEKYFSTAHGAFESGFDQAQKLLKFYVK